VCEKKVNEEVVKLCLACFVEKLLFFFLVFECVYNPFGFYCVAFFRQIFVWFLSCFVFVSFLVLFFLTSKFSPSVLDFSVLW